MVFLKKYIDAISFVGLVPDKVGKPHRKRGCKSNKTGWFVI